MSRQHSAFGVAAETDFPVNDINQNLISGLVTGSFTYELWNPSGVDVSGSIPVTISELGNGNYRSQFTPNATGDWTLVVKHATYFPMGRRMDYAIDVSDNVGVAMKGGVPVLDANQNFVTGLVQGNFTYELWNPSGLEVSGVGVGEIPVTLVELGNGNYRTAFTPDVTGFWTLVVFHATYFPMGQRAYYTILATDGAPTWASNFSNISAVDAASDGEVDLTWDAATPSNGNPVGYISEYRTAAGPGSWTESGRSIITAFTVPNLTNGTKYDFRVKAYSRISGEPTQTATDTAWANPTRSATPPPSIGVVATLGLLRRTPHSVLLKRPDVARDTDNNVATRDYENPTRTTTVRCLFQSRGGEVSVGDEGNIVPFDAKMYTLEKDVQVNDRIEVDLPLYTGNFLVTAVVPKARQSGIYSHNEIFLQKDGVR